MLRTPLLNAWSNTLSTVPGAQYAGITLARPSGYIETPATTHRYPVLLDEIQQQYKQGPCFVAAWHQHTVRIDDLVEDKRWPNYRRDALAATSIKSILSFRLFASEQTMGALNLYSDKPYAFDEAAEEIAYVLATHAALAWDTVRREDHFLSALTSRDIIDQAKGILMPGSTSMSSRRSNCSNASHRNATPS